MDLQEFRLEMVAIQLLSGVESPEKRKSGHLEKKKNVNNYQSKEKRLLVRRKFAKEEQFAHNTLVLRCQESFQTTFGCGRDAD